MGVFALDPSTGHTIKDVVGQDHSHPAGIQSPSGTVLEGMSPDDETGDIANARLIHSQNPNVIFNIYTPSNGKYTPYDENTKTPTMPEIIITVPKKKEQ